MYAHILKGAPLGNCNAIGGKVGECGKGASNADKKFKKGNKGSSSRNTKSISGKAYIASLEKDGWKVDRVSGSHHIMTKPGYRSFPVPNHNKDLGIGLLRALNKLSQTKT